LKSYKGEKVGHSDLVMLHNTLPFHDGTSTPSLVILHEMASKICFGHKFSFDVL